MAILLNKVNYSIQRILPADELVLKQGIYVSLIHATHIPPHLALFVNGKYFALSVKGPEVEQELGVVLRTIRLKRIPSLFISLKVPELFTIDQLNSILKKITLSYPRLDVGIATCLNPIKDFCTSVYDTETRNVNFIFDLLPKLQEQDVIGACFHLFLDRFLENKSFELRKYTMEEINAGIRKSRGGVMV